LFESNDLTMEDKMFMR